MENLQNILLTLRNHCVRYGRIAEDSKCEITGHNDRITTFIIDGKRITIDMHNGIISNINYR